VCQRSWKHENSSRCFFFGFTVLEYACITDKMFIEKANKFGSDLGVALDFRSVFMFWNKAVLFTYIWFYMHTIDRNNYRKSYLLCSTPETTRGNENITSLCFIGIAIQILELPKRYDNLSKRNFMKTISWRSIFFK
jgi:hypothetical protein